MDIQINNYSVTVLESLFRTLKNAGWQEISDAAVYLYNFVSKEGIYPKRIVEGFYSAMVIMSDMSTEQFWQVKSLYCIQNDKQ